MYEESVKSLMRLTENRAWALAQTSSGRSVETSILYIMTVQLRVESIVQCLLAAAYRRQIRAGSAILFAVYKYLRLCPGWRGSRGNPGQALSL